ncbi:MAG: PKD domain-containing protein, partial [Chitinophagaceae bacterium]
MRTSLKLVLLLTLSLFQCFQSRAQVSSFTMSYNSGCAPLTVNFANTSSGAVDSLNWTLGNGTNATSQTPSTTYFNPGVYYVKLAVIRPGITDTVRDSIHIYDKPTVSFSGTNLTGCAYLPVSFSSTVIPNSFGTVKYAWDFGDGAGDTISANPTHSYTTAGNYPVSLNVTNGAGCSRSVFTSGYVKVFPRPQITFTGSGLSFCNSITSITSFSSTVNSGTKPFNYSWNYGDNSLGLSANPSHHYTVSGLFSVNVLVVDSNGCRDSFFRPDYVFVNDTPAAFSMPPVICSGDSVYFRDTTAHTLGLTHWYFGDGDTAYGLGVAHVYAAGVPSATVTMTTKLSSCIKSLIKTLTINPAPSVTITQTPLIPCPAPSTVTFTANSATAISYAWAWQSGGTASGITVAKTYTSFIFNDVLDLIVTDANGCKGRASIDTIRVRDICVGVNNGFPIKGCVPLTRRIPLQVRTSNPSLPSFPKNCNEDYPVAVTSWTWDLGNGMTSTLPTPTATYDSIRDYFPSVVITTANGCTGSGVGTAHPDTPVHPSFTVNPLTYCPGEIIHFQNTTSVPFDSLNTLFAWGIYGSVPGGDTSFGFVGKSDLYYGIKHSGLYSIRMSTNHYSCLDTFYQDDYITINPPDADFTFLNPCSPSRTVQFTNTSVKGDRFLWLFGDGSTDTTTNTAHAYVNGGKYIVRLVANNNQYSCTDTQAREVEVYIPHDTITSTYTAACTGNPIYFFAHTDYSHYIQFSFVFDDTLQTAFGDQGFTSYAFSQVGFHPVYMVASYGNGCLDTVSLPVPVLIAHPSIRIIPTPPIGCAPLQVKFTDSTTNAPTVPTFSRVWVFAAGDTVLDSQVIHRLYTQKGEYPIYLKVTDSLQCESFIYKDSFLSVSTAYASFTASKYAACLHDSINFSAVGGGRKPLHFDWDFGDGYFDTGTVVSHRYASMGTFHARLIVTDSVGCSDTSIQAIVVQSPTAAFTQSDSLIICPPQTVHFTSTASGFGPFTYSWDFDLNGGPVNGPNPLATFSTPKVYTITQVVTNPFGCTDTARSVVRALGYNGAFSYTPLSGCAPMEVVFTPPLGGIPQITWDFNDGSTSITGDTITSHIYTIPGKYLPRVIFSDGKLCKTP